MGTCSQILLKKSADKHHSNILGEYLNPLVLLGYSILFISTLLVVVAYQGVELKYGPILESTGYIYILFFSWYFFKEKISARKIFGVLIIIIGIVVFCT